MPQSSFAGKKKRKASSKSATSNHSSKKKSKQTILSYSSPIEKRSVSQIKSKSKKKVCAVSGKELWRSLGFPSSYQKQVVTMLMDDVVEEKVNRKTQITWTCPRDPKLCKRKGKVGVSSNWTNAFSHMVSLCFISLQFWNKLMLISVTPYFSALAMVENPS